MCYQPEHQYGTQGGFSKENQEFPYPKQKRLQLEMKDGCLLYAEGIYGYVISYMRTVCREHELTTTTSQHKSTPPAKVANITTPHRRISRSWLPESRGGGREEEEG